MPAILGLWSSALWAAGRGISNYAWQKEVRALGLGARASEMSQLFKIAQSVVTAAPQEPFRNVHQAPVEADLVPWPTRKATGIRQNVTLTYRDRTTGQIKQTFWSTIGSSPITREQAVAMAIDAYSEHAESYGQDLIGAVHTSAYRMTPDMFQLCSGAHTGYGPTTRNACRRAW